MPAIRASSRRVGEPAGAAIPWLFSKPIAGLGLSPSTYLFAFPEEGVPTAQRDHSLLYAFLPGLSLALPTLRSSFWLTPVPCHAVG